MADWVSSLLAGLGAGAESLGTSMTERDKRTAAAKQRNMELSNEMAMKMAEFGMSPDVNLPTSAAVQGIGNLRMTTPDPITSFAKNLSIGQDTGKSLAPSPRFDVFSGTEAAPPIDLADPLQNHGKFKGLGPAVSRGPVSAYGAPTMPRTKLGLAAQVPNVQAEVNAPPMTTGAGDENLPRMSLIDPVTGESTRYKRDITQSLPYLQMQANTKANEERDAARQEAQGVREAAAQAVKNANTLREQAAAKENASRANYEYIKVVDPQNISVQGRWEDLTVGQRDSLQRVADTVKDRDRIRTTAKYRPAPTAKQLAQQSVYKKESTTLDNAKDAVAAYRKQLKDVGVELWPTKGKVLLSGAYNNVMLQAKEIAKLGVLAGPDMGIIEGVVGNPTSLKSGLLNFMGNRSDNLMAGLDQYETMLDRMRSRLDANYLNAPEPQNNNSNLPPGFEPAPSGQPEGDQ